MKAFIGTNIIDVKTESILQDQVIIVDGPSIAQIIPSAESSNLNLDSMEEIYDVSGLTVLPGLIDCHDHLASKNYELISRWN